MSLEDTRPFRVWFWYNHIRRHYNDMRFWFIWKLSKDPMKPKCMSRSGAFGVKEWNWANSVIKEVELE
jgi:hypothetical protein